MLPCSIFILLCASRCQKTNGKEYSGEHEYTKSKIPSNSKIQRFYGKFVAHIQNYSKCYSLIHIFVSFFNGFLYLNYLFYRKRAWRRRGREQKSLKQTALSTESNWGLHLMTLRSQPWIQNLSQNQVLDT